MFGKRSKYFLVGVVLLLAIAALLLKLVWSAPHQPFEYMVAGTGITAVVLLAVFLVLVGRGALR